MSKLTKNQRISTLERQVTALITLVKMKGYNESEPQLKQLDQSVFDGLDEKWRFAAVDKNGLAAVFDGKPKINAVVFDVSDELGGATKYEFVGEDYYDASNWQNSLIERESKAPKTELTGSDLCRAMLERGDKFVMCRVGNINDVTSSKCCAPSSVITKVKNHVSEGGWHFYADDDNAFLCAVPINNQGKPLTASEAGL